MSATDASWLCICGCGQPAKTGSQYASDACRARRYDQKNPRVSKAPPELLKALVVEKECLGHQYGAPGPEGELAVDQKEEAWDWLMRSSPLEFLKGRPPRRPRPPRIHIDVLGEDAELLDRLACEAGISRTAYVSYLIRRAGGRDVE